jgi:hypothetical protein
VPDITLTLPNAPGLSFALELVSAVQMAV